MDTKVINIEVPDREFKCKFRYAEQDCEIIFKRVTIDEISQIQTDAVKLQAMEGGNAEDVDISEMKTLIDKIFNVMLVKKNFDWPLTNLPLAAIKAILEPAMMEQGIPSDKKKLS